MKQKLKSKFQAVIMEARQAANHVKVAQSEKELQSELMTVDQRFQKSVDCLVD